MMYIVPACACQNEISLFYSGLLSFCGRGGGAGGGDAGVALMCTESRGDEQARRGPYKNNSRNSREGGLREFNSHHEFTTRELSLVFSF